MRKYIIIITGGFLFILFFIPLVSFLSKNQSLQQKLPFFFISPPTPVPAPQTTFMYKPPAIISSNPTDGQTNIPTTTPITISFNRPITSDEITFWIGPGISAATTISGTTLTALPTTTLTPGSIYGYSIKFKDGTPSKTYYFTTVGQGPAVNNPKYDPVPNLFKSQDKQLHPDTYLSNNMPYTGTLFHVSYSYTQAPNSHIYFTVLLYGSDQSQAKAEFSTWVKSFGITDDQITTMDIRYVSPNGEL